MSSETFLGFAEKEEIFKLLFESPPYFFKKLGFTPCKAEQPLQGMELQEKEAQKD